MLIILHHIKLKQNQAKQKKEKQHLITMQEEQKHKSIFYYNHQARREIKMLVKLMTYSKLD